VASAPVPASRPDHSKRLTRGLSVIAADSIRTHGVLPARPPANLHSAAPGPQAYASRPRQIVSTIRVFA
jgi:hypothetical protein